MTIQKLRSPLMFAAALAILLALVSMAQAQSRPRQVNRQTEASSAATRPRRATSATTPALISEKAAAKRVDDIFRRLDELLSDYLRPMAVKK